MPKNTPDLIFDVVTMTAAGFRIRYQTSDIRKSYLGFNFAVIRPDMPTENIKHGIITECTDVATTTLSVPNAIAYPKYGISVDTDYECTPDGGNGEAWVQSYTNPGPPRHHGVKINFDTPFNDLPSVAATPHGQFGGTTLISRCLIEALTKSYAIVKCAVLNDNPNNEDYRPIPFSFVAVGN